MTRDDKPCGPHVCPTSGSDIVERVLSDIEHRHDELVQTVSDLVRLPSTLGNEAMAQHYVADHLRGSGLDVNVWESDESLRQVPGAGDPGVPFAGRPNVAGVMRGKGQRNGRSLILLGHIDVVSPEPLDDWSTAPWVPTIIGDRMYGRGAFDMKAGIAIILMIARVLRENGVELDGDLIIQSVIEEESSGNGALDASRRYHADAAIITESTDEKFVYAHVGVVWFRVIIEGKAAHVGKALEGVNAILKAVPVIREIEAMDRQLNEMSHPEFVGVPHPVGVNIGIIRGGDWPGTLAGRCELECRVGFFPGISTQTIRDMVDTAMHRAAEGDAWLEEHPPQVTYFGHHDEGSMVAMDEPIVRTLGSWHEKVRGGEMPSRVDTGTLDMRYFNRKGIPAGNYGATGERAHAADEWLDITSLVPTAKVLAGVVMDWCKTVDSPDS